ncbi:MAG: hypothetical protein HYU76_06540, partial [Betaproteobacteria bacterium]|nr:hypothetical protein [Betaproteobacteria bacterium]
GFFRRALCLDPSVRFPTATDMRLALERLLPASTVERAAAKPGPAALPHYVGLGKVERGLAVRLNDLVSLIEGHLAAAGTSKAKLLWANVWLTDIREKGEMDAAWMAWVDPDGKPVRACVEARLATPDTRVEIMVTAASAVPT